MAASTPTGTALIIGASRGLGLALAETYLARGWHVIGTVRRATGTGLHALAATAGGRLEIEQADINEPAQMEALRATLAGRVIDLLFVNAGISNGAAETIATVSTDSFIRTMVTNALSPMRAVEAFEGLVPQSGTIAVMSSGLGSVADNTGGGWEVYRASKAALNTLMRSFAARHAGDARSMAIIAPGWVRTDMGGPGASLAIEESIPRVVDVLTAHSGKPGLRYLDYRGQTVAW
ncbi:SDR family NAD(P)-dependent oxidoreductase [Acidiphilium sp. PA]|uniref:SDR family NAD(P)-dependent oxidoreductase n=1 Tax=Acidiphilium sp. PA TaxID=2871705 RepID=UPI002243E692|nr:SDR family NAD(P)-dependent oxidoreductase [Acidiphilium sp. PA]MCW8305976.1 SDR family NAD(P)-dependent oxidoreductase [Acidiphilium sp. PA]